MTANWDTLPGRLRWAIKRPTFREGRQRGVRQFQRRMKAHAKEIAESGGLRLEGVALSSIQGYLNGDVDPPLRFIQEAARVLGLREAWLAFNDGFPTEEEQAIAVGIWKERPANLPGIESVFRQERIEKVLAESSLGYRELPDAARESVLRGFDTYCKLRPALEKLGHTSPTEQTLATWYAGYLAAPFTVLGIDAAALEPAERSLVIDALLRPVDVFKWAARREAGRRRQAERAAGQAELEKDPRYSYLTGDSEHEDEAEQADTERRASEKEDSA